ncbi:MAG: hypothetical protein MUC56_13615 [Thermoanaerobaculales bacterium]|jgi:hypothetical protein|nr:hypothetical protein [Thermoanaerobaculales bacterium]
MRSNRCTSLVLGTSLLFVLCLGVAPCAAGPYTDALSMCLVKHTSEADKTTLVKWIFATIALHPEVESMAAISYEQRDALNEQCASMVQRLLTESCRTETTEAIKYEGNAAIEGGFNILGQVATRELFTNPAVAQGMAEFGAYLDEDAFESLLEAPPAEETPDQ